MKIVYMVDGETAASIGAQIEQVATDFFELPIEKIRVAMQDEAYVAHEDTGKRMFRVLVSAHPISEIPPTAH